jgi:hypothetical protein
MHTPSQNFILGWYNSSSAMLKDVNAIPASTINLYVNLHCFVSA